MGAKATDAGRCRSGAEMDPRAAASAVAPAQLRACAPCLTDIARSPYIQFEPRALGCGSIAMKGDTMNSDSETMVTGLFADRAGAESGGIVMGVRPRSQEDGTYLQREWATAGKDVYRSATQAQRA